jgi:hypothetical protein
MDKHMNEKEESGVIVIQTAQGDHVGFTLTNPDLGNPNGDCVFVIAPKKAELFETPEVDALLSFKENGEHQWRWMDDEIYVSFQGDDVLKYSTDKKLIHIPSGIQVGIWRIVPKKK